MYDVSAYTPQDRSVAASEHPDAQRPEAHAFFRRHVRKELLFRRRVGDEGPHPHGQIISFETELREEPRNMT